MTRPPLPSLWLETTPETAYPALEGELDVDVAVVGAGITGITAAFLLKREGLRVALLDSKRILHGVTGYTTAKVTSGHGAIYQHLRKKFGADGARTYAQSQEAALERIATIVAEEGIECDFERRPNYVYADTPDELPAIQREHEAARAAGLPVSLVQDVPLPYPVAGAVRLENQAQIHPRRYLLALAAAVQGGGSHVLELTRAVDVDRGEPCRVRTERGEIRARDVFVATHIPILDRGFFFAKAHPERSYALAARIHEEALPAGMFINVGSPTRSVRTARDDAGPLLLVGGEGHKPGTERDTDRRYRALEAFALRHWDVADFPYRWSAQDYVSVDRVPYIGRITRGSRHVYAATGFGKWGMTSGTLAAAIVVDAILGRENAYASLYRANRLKPRASAGKFMKENAAVARHFVGDRLATPEGGELSDVAAGEGRILKIEGRKRAVYRDETGGLHVLSPACTHMGCHVSWNAAERSWDCPCHGSRFAGDGRVIQGPAVDDLERRGPEAAGDGDSVARR